MKKLGYLYILSGGIYLQSINGVIIGDNCLIGPGVKIISANHDPSNYQQWLKDVPIVIEKNCWIGANAVILPGVTIGEHSVIGAGAVVTCHIPANSIAVGNPARVLRSNNGTSLIKSDG